MKQMAEQEAFTHPVLVTWQAVLGTLALAVAVHVWIQGSSNLDAALVVANMSTGCAKYCAGGRHIETTWTC